MNQTKKIKSALISVFHKENIDKIVKSLDQKGVKIYSTGGTQRFIEGLGVAVHSVEELTNYPSILGGRVKTLHPKVFGGILSRRENENDLEQLKQYDIPEIDLVIVDLYPFEQTLASGASNQEIIEKIDIGGISLIRAAAKNYKDLVVVPSMEYYDHLLGLLEEKDGGTDLSDRKFFAAAAFNISSHYDSCIFKYFAGDSLNQLKISETCSTSLRYGENPHQKGVFYGNLDDLFEQVHGKEISYNNLLDIDAAVHLMHEFKETGLAILKHNNACGLALRDTVKQSWIDALAGDPVSAYGGIVVTNREVDLEAAEEINKIFFEVIIAPSYQPEALEILKSKKNRIILIQKDFKPSGFQIRTMLNGYLGQERDLARECEEDMKAVSKRLPTNDQLKDLVFANILVKHTKSNAIVLAKEGQLIASGVGQTSRVDALKQAIDKAGQFGFDLNGAVMASDAFFPFKDSVEIAHKAGICAVVQPGGSIRDKESIDFCDEHDMAMVFTGVRHFKH